MSEIGKKPFPNGSDLITIEKWQKFSLFLYFPTSTGQKTLKLYDFRIATALKAYAIPLVQEIQCNKLDFSCFFLS